jgi:hypothetical protein
MNRRQFTLAALFGQVTALLGAKLGAQDSGTIYVGASKTMWCTALDGSPQPCELKEGEEHCPLGHVQKPGLVCRVGDKDGQWTGVLWPEVWEAKPTGEAEGLFERVCSICGIVYVHVRKKP